MGSPSETQVLNDLTAKTVNEMAKGQCDVNMLNSLQSLAKARTEHKQNSTIHHNAEIIKQQLSTIGELNQEISKLRLQKEISEKVPQGPPAVPETVATGSARGGAPGSGGATVCKSEKRKAREAAKP